MQEQYERYTVGENEWLLKIAQAFEFRDEMAIINANPGLLEIVHGNTDVLPPGLRLNIPTKRMRTEPALVDKINWYLARVRTKNLRIRFTVHSSSEWIAALTVNGNQMAISRLPADVTGERLPRPITYATFGISHPPDLPPGVLKPARAVPGPINYSIPLQVGGLDPIVGSAKVAAVQKILTNLGYYTGNIGASLDGSPRAALAAFQQCNSLPVTGCADATTCAALVHQQGNVIAYEAFEESTKSPDEKHRLLLADAEASVEQASVRPGNEYLEPTAPTNAAAIAIPNSGVLPTIAYVAPSDPGNEEQNPNIIRSVFQRFIFMDTGRWLKTARDFGVVWGRHVYLCQYKSGSKGSWDPSAPVELSSDTPNEPGERLDAQFFRMMRQHIRVVKNATAAWARDEEFNWGVLYVILPDLHLMGGPAGMAWREGGHDLQPEIDLLKFSREITSLGPLSKQIRLVEIGDSYDLWVGYELLFKDTTRLVVELSRPDAAQTIAEWVREVQGLNETSPTTGSRFDETADANERNWVKQIFFDRGDQALFQPVLRAGAASTETRRWTTSPRLVAHNDAAIWLNPAELAFHILERGLGGVDYIWGNHDNYLSLPDVCDAAGLRQRVRYIQDGGLFVEHGHRMEILFAIGAVICWNYDGITTGWKVTENVYRKRLAAMTKGAGRGDKAIAWAADKGDALSEEYAAVHDQPGYWTEYARVRCGHFGSNQAPTHIHVIGHTHMPGLWYIDVDRLTGKAWQLTGDPTKEGALPVSPESPYPVPPPPR